MAKEHLIEHYGDAALHDRHRLLGRLARRSSGSPTPTRASTRGSCRPARSPTRGAGDAVPRLPPDARYFEDPSQWGAGVAWTPTQMADVEGHPDARQRASSPTTRSSTSSIPTDPCDGITDRAALRPDDQPGRRALHDPGRGDQRLRPAPAVGVDPAGEADRPRLRRHAGRQRRRAVRPRRAAAAARSRRPSSSTSTRRSAASTPTSNPTPRAHAAPTDGARQRLPQRHDQRDQQPQPHRDHRLPRARPGLFHDAYRAFAVRARLDRAHGNHATSSSGRDPTR